MRMFSNSNMEERGRRKGKENTGGSKQATEPTPPAAAPTPAVPPHRADEDAEAAGGGSDPAAAVAAVDEQLDVCSERFDPLLALYSAAPPPLPYPNMKCFNNVAHYESFLRGGPGRAKAQNVERRQRKAMKGVADPERIARLRQLMVNKNPTSTKGGEVEEGEASGSSTKAVPRRGQKKIKNVLTRMLLCKGSPLGELQRCVEEKIRVKVHIRTFKGLRGICSGFVVAFDKFWNLAMVDVDETYREPLLGEAFYHEKALTVTRLFEKLKLQEQPEEGGEPQARKHTGQGKTGIPQPETSKRTQETSLTDSKSRDPRLSTTSTMGVKDDEPGPTTVVKPPKAPETSQEAQKKKEKKSGHPYGKVHTRHINQLFVRGENVLLINPQPL